MADAIDVVADVLALVRERDEAREMRDVSQRQADAALAAMHEAARQVEMLRAERNKVIAERDVLAFEIEDVRAALGSPPIVEIVRVERERVRDLAAHVTTPEDAVAFIEDLKRGDL